MKNDGLTTKERARRIQLFWEGKTNTPKFKELETKRNKYLAEKAESEGKKVTYVANDGSATLPEVLVTSQKPIQKPYWSNMTTDDWIDTGITAASFVPGLDTVADIADTANQFRQGNWGWGLVGLGTFILPGISLPLLKKGFETIYDLVKSPYNNYKRRKLSDNIIKKLLIVGEISQEEAEHLRKVKLKTSNINNNFNYYDNIITVPKKYNGLDKGFSLGHEFGHKLAEIRNNKDPNFLSLFYLSHNPGLYRYSSENILDETQYAEMFSDYIGTLIESGKEALKYDKKYDPEIIPILQQRINHFIPYHYPSSNTQPKIISYNPIIDKSKTIDFSKALSNIQLLDIMDKFAEKYGYPKADRSVILSNRKTNKQARKLIARHNTYLRGVLPNGFEPDDIQKVKGLLGDDITDELFMRYAATNKRTPSLGLWISPENNAFIYGGRDNTALVRRKYKLGNNRTKWFNEGDFNLLKNPGLEGKSWDGITGIVAPWYTQMSKGIPETELLSMDNLNFAGWANFNNWKNKVSLNNKVKE